MTSEALLLDRYRVVNAVPPRLGGQAFLAEDAGAGGSVVELHVLPGSAQAEQAYPPVRQAIEALRGVPPGPIARALDLVWGPEGELVLAQEYAEGRTLADLMAAGPLPPARAREVLRGILHALAVARRQNLTHGGLSPWRVLVDPATDDRVVVLDLGVMALAAPSEPEAAYRAPGDARGARADGFAVAVIALELLAGKKPGEGRAVGDVPAEAQQAVGAELVKAVQALVRADGSARAFDAGALLGLLPARRRRTRRSRFTLRETWDGDIGAGTARLLKLGLRPEYRDRMPAEIQGTGALAVEDDDAPIHFQDSVHLHRAAASAPGDARRTQPELQVPPRVEAKVEPRVVPEPAPAKPAPPPPAPRPIEIKLEPRLPSPQDVTVSLPPPPARSRPTDLFAEVDRALDGGSGGALTLPHPPPPPPALAPTLPPTRLPAALVLRAAHGKQAVFLVAPRDGAMDLGRERGNDVIVRAFKGSTVENIESNRISRKHLYLLRRSAQVLIADGQREGPTKASTYGSTLDGARLPVEKRGSESVGVPTPLPLDRAFEVVLAATTCRLEGRVFPGTQAVRLARKDGVGHEYVVLWGAGEVGLGSGEAEDALLLPPEGGIVPGHARVSIDAARGLFQVSPHRGAVKLGGRDVAKGAWAALDGSQKLQLGAVTFSLRPVADQDYLVVGADLVMP